MLQLNDFQLVNISSLILSTTSFKLRSGTAQNKATLMSAIKR